MKIASWNINGIKARLHTVQSWLEKADPDIVALQEIKSVDEAFPQEPFETLGYNVYTHGQKGFNGVALLSKSPLEDIECGLPGDENDTQARFISAFAPIGPKMIRVTSLYLPNGNPLASEKFSYKLKWMSRLREWAHNQLDMEEDFILAGDFNVIPQPIDCYDPEAWKDDALFQPETRAQFYALQYLGLTDALRATSYDQVFTFWDFQAGAWPKNNGIRIDHMLLSPGVADRLQECQIDRETRGWEKPSDHVPIWIRLSQD